MKVRSHLPEPARRAIRPVHRTAASIERGVRLSWLRFNVKRSIARGHLAIDFRNRVGFGARLMWCLQVLAYSDEHQIDVDFRFSTPSAPDVDFFSPFFGVRQLSGPTRSRHFIATDTIRTVPYVPGENLSLERASELALKYLYPRGDVRREVDDFWQTHGLDGNVLGVHYRGTDKSDEAPRVEYDVVGARVATYLTQNSDTSAIFVSSDEAAFITYAMESFGTLPIVSRDDFRRSESRREVYRDDVLEIQRDAAINCLLLARCAGLVKTASFLSAISFLFNPDMDVFILNRPHEDSLWFPESEMLRRQDSTSPQG